MKEIAKAVWNWRILPSQFLRDYRFHRQVKVTAPPLWRRLVEQAALLWTNRVTAKDYYKFGLFDPAMPRAVKRTYIGEFQPWKMLTPVNDPAFYDLTDDKLKFQKRALASGLPVPEILATLSAEGADLDVPNLVSEQAFAEWMTANDISDVVLKPIGGLMGRGVVSLGERLPDTAAWRSLPDGRTLNAQALWEHCQSQRRHGGMFVQRRVAPHPELARIVPNVLHTVRVVTFLDPQPRVIDAVLRVGNGRVAADNMHSGGIAVPVDLATGRCGDGALVVDGLTQDISHHPLTGERIAGTLLPDWQQVLDLAVTAARTFDMQRSLGWDIGLSDRGPVLLEGNWRYDLVILELAQRRGSLDSPWIDVFNDGGAYRDLSLGFSNRPRRRQPDPTAPRRRPA